MVGARKWPFKRATGIIPGSDLSGVTALDLIEVTLLTDVAGQPTELPHLVLSFGELGMTVKKPDGAPYALIPWLTIQQMSAEAVGPQRHQLSTVASLSVETSRKRHRFLVPNVQLDVLTGSLGAMSERYGRGELVLNGAPRGMRRH